MTKVPALRAILLQPLQEKKVLRFRLLFLPTPIHHPPSSSTYRDRMRWAYFRPFRHSSGCTGGTFPTIAENRL